MSFRVVLDTTRDSVPESRCTLRPWRPVRLRALTQRSALAPHGRLDLVFQIKHEYGHAGRCCGSKTRGMAPELLPMLPVFRLVPPCHQRHPARVHNDSIERERQPGAASPTYGKANGPIP